MEANNIHIHNLTLRETLNKYAKPGTTFSFVGATDEKNKQVLSFLQNYYDSKNVSVGSDEIELFNNLTVADNIYIENIYTFGRRQQKQLDQCQALFDWLNFHVDPMTLVRNLSAEEKRIVELMKMYERGSEVIILCNITSFLGYHYYEIFMEMIKLFQCRGTTVILLTTHWEDTLKFSKFIAVMTGEELFSVMSIEEVARNPRKIIFALAGGVDGTAGGYHNNSVDVLSTVFKGAELFVENKEFANALRFLASSVIEAMAAQSCVIYFESDDGRIFHFSDQKKISEQYLLQESYVSRVIRSSDSVVFLSKRSCNFSDLFYNASRDVRILFCLPISVIPARIGLLAVTYDHYFVYREEQLTLLKAFGHEVARIMQTSQMVNHSVLLQESYHRIKNNLQMIVSLVYMQKAYFLEQKKEVTDTDIAIAFDDIVSRIKSIACVHEFMAGDELGSNIIRLDYVAEKIIKIYRDSSVKVIVDSEEIRISCNKAVSIAMMLNELICNCYRHAFTDIPDEKYVHVTIKNKGDNICLTVKDNGIGIPEPEKFLTSASVGATIISNIVRELRAEISVRSDCGTVTEIKIPKTITINDFLPGFE